MAESAGGKPLVALSGFSPLTGEVLALALSRHDLQVTSLDQPLANPPTPDVVVVSVDHNTLTRLAELRATLPSTPIVVVVPSTAGSVVQAARRIEAAALVPRSAGLGQLTRILEVVLSGGHIEETPSELDDELATLTERELAVLRLVAAGSSNAEIGTVLGISPNTARTHVQNTMGKLGVRTRLAATAIARNAGLTPYGAA